MFTWTTNRLQSRQGTQNDPANQKHKTQLQTAKENHLWVGGVTIHVTLFYENAILTYPRVNANNWAGISPSVFNDHHQHKSMLSLPGIRQTWGPVTFCAVYCIPLQMHRHCGDAGWHAKVLCSRSFPSSTHYLCGVRSQSRTEFVYVRNVNVYKFSAFFGLHWEVMILDQHITVHQMSA